MNNKMTELAKMILETEDNDVLVRELRLLIEEGMADWDGWYEITSEGKLHEELKKEVDRKYAELLDAVR